MLSVTDVLEMELVDDILLLIPKSKCICAILGPGLILYYNYFQVAKRGVFFKVDTFFFFNGITILIAFFCTYPAIQADSFHTKQLKKIK